MKKVEYIAGAILFFGVILKYAFPFSGSLYIGLSSNLLAILYYPLGFALLNNISFLEILKKTSYSNISKMRLFGAFGAGLTFSITIIGIFFRSMRFAGSGLMIGIGIMFSLIVLTFSILKYYKSKDSFYKGIIKRSIIIGGFALIYFYIPTMELIKIEYRNHPDFIKAYEEYRNDRKNRALYEKVNYEDSIARMAEKGSMKK